MIPTTFSAAVKMNKRQSKKVRCLLNPLTRPVQVPTSRRVKWRLVKKWFNRYSCFKNRRTNSYAHNRCENRKSWRTPA